jgi:hypothetical protein
LRVGSCINFFIVGISVWKHQFPGKGRIKVLEERLDL